MEISIFFSVLFSLLTGWFLLQPHLTQVENVPDFAPAGNKSSLLDRKVRTIQMLRDLDLDKSTGKLSEDEYGRLKNEISVELAEVLKEEDLKA